MRTEGALASVEPQANTHQESPVDHILLYKPLDSRKHDIRLVRLLCNDSEAFQCELRIFPLDEGPEYQALSYCWTAADPTCRVLVNGTPFYIRPNLFNYLNLRDRERDSGWIFIDAICINQQDVAERGHQVRLMGDVYRQATQVVVWLGSEARWKGCVTWANKAFEQYCDGSRELNFDPRCGELSEPFCELLWSLFKRAFLPPEYWLRAWIVQEVALSRSLILRYRHLTLDAYKFQSIIWLHWTRENQWEEDGPYPKELYSLGESDIEEETFDQGEDGRLYVYPGRWREDNRRRCLSTLHIARSLMEPITAGSVGSSTMYEVICTFAEQECSEWRDTIYSLVGLTDSYFPVDYVASRIKLYARVLIECTLEITIQKPSVYKEPGLTALDAVLSILPRALQIDPLEPVVALITCRAMKNCGLQDTVTLYEKHRISYLVVKRVSAIHEERMRVSKKKRPDLWRSIRMYKLLPCLRMPAVRGEPARTYQGWKKWTDSLQQDAYVRVHKRLSAQKCRQHWIYDFSLNTSLG